MLGGKGGSRGTRRGDEKKVWTGNENLLGLPRLKQKRDKPTISSRLFRKRRRTPMMTMREFETRCEGERKRDKKKVRGKR